MKKIIALILALTMLSLAGCGSSDPVTLDTQKVFQDLMYAEGMPSMSALDESMMLNLCGIRKEDTVSARVAVSTTGLEAAEVWVIEAADADALSRLQELAQTRLKQKGEESKTYSPEQYKIVEKAQVLTEGNYLALVAGPRADAMADIFNTACGK